MARGDNRHLDYIKIALIDSHIRKINLKHTFFQLLLYTTLKHTFLQLFLFTTFVLPGLPAHEEINIGLQNPADPFTR